ncbi:MAG: transketolase family protein [Candidatus Omnitrophica bacterium]|nr:transketolase family protein [Candidatus Omnitrophota bacterium]
MTESKPTRDGFGEALVELGRKNPDVVVLSADLTSSTRANYFMEVFPERFFKMGVAEQDMIGTAAGFALMGKVPFACTFGIFATGKTWEQLRVSVCSMKLNVKLAGSHGGITVGADGATHQALEEITLMRALSNMTILIPCDYIEAKKATLAAYSFAGPVYLRLGKETVPIVTREDDPFEIGKANILREGSDLTIIACGIMVAEALRAADELEKKGIGIKVINLHTIKPIDNKTIIDAAKHTGAILTAEEHTVMGGLGGAVAEVVVRNYPVPMDIVGVNDTFGQSGKPHELVKLYNLTYENLIERVKLLIRRKQGFRSKY